MNRLGFFIFVVHLTGYISVDNHLLVLHRPRAEVFSLMTACLVQPITGKICEFTFLSQRRAHVATTPAIFISPPMSVFAFFNAICGGHSFSL